MRTLAACLLALLLPAAACAQGAVTPRPLNDTGILFCGTGSIPYENNVCPSGPAGQDALYGRDAAAQAGALFKQGGSTLNNSQTNGFDYTKIANDGSELPATATLGSNSNDWACTRDNVTGLIWEVKTSSGLRGQGWTYTWYDGTGTPYFGSNCGGFVSGCNTQAYVAAVNALSPPLCGHTDWRMPTDVELQGIVDYGRNSPAIDPGYFPNTPSSFVWSGSPRANDPDLAWFVSFDDGYAYPDFRNHVQGVRLVRAGQ